MAPKSKKKNETRSKTSRGADAISQRQKTPAPNWPLFQPLIPSSQLYLEPIIENQIVVIKNFWTSTLCKNYVSFLKSLPLITTPGKPKKGEAVRVNDRFQIEDAAFAERLWSDTSLKELVTGAGAEGEDKNLLWGGEVLGLNPNIRIYRYSDGQFFAQHYDDTNTLHFPPSPSTPTTKIPAHTTWTLLIYLTSASTGCLGGETVFYPDDSDYSSTNMEKGAPIVVELETGMALLHRHGERCMLHEGREVRGGEKWVVRSDLVVRR